MLKYHLHLTGGGHASNFFPRDNARPHTAKVAQAELRSDEWTLLSFPAYSPDIPLTDVHHYSALQRFLNEQHFENENEGKGALGNFFELQPSTF